MKLGYILGPLFIIAGAIVTYYTGMMIVFASHETQKDRYEDIARAIYGEKVANITSILNFVCLIGFVSSYVVFVKSAMS